MPTVEPRAWLPDWIVNVIALLFGVTMVAQPYVIPSGSMENSLLVGDHVIVDKLAFAPAGTLGGRLLPYTPIRRGDIIVFRFPLDPRQTYVKRVIGLPGDRIRIAARQVYVNGRPLAEPYKIHKAGRDEDYRDRFPRRPARAGYLARRGHAARPRARRGTGGAAGQLLRAGR